MASIFRFKEFTIDQEKSAMKIGTDGVLLGAWCTADFPNSILDVGSGTGVIALMMAQRFDSETIDAVEIDEIAYEQTVENFEQSIWADRLFCYNASITDFANQMAQENESYDLIVSNPPFYSDDFETKDEARNKARFTSSLSFENLIVSVVKILSKNGKFAVIVPAKEKDNFINLANTNSLFLNRICHVKGNIKTPIKRSLLEFSFHQTEVLHEELSIEIERHQYTKEYIDLVKDFYINM